MKQTTAAENILTLKALLVRERRWRASEGACDERDANIAALQWAIGYKHYCHQCKCAACGNSLVLNAREG